MTNYKPLGIGAAAAAMLATASPVQEANAAALTVNVGTLPTPFNQVFELVNNDTTNIYGQPAGITSFGEGDVYSKTDFNANSGSANYSVAYDFSLAKRESFSGSLDPFSDASFSLYKGAHLLQTVSGSSGTVDLDFKSLAAGNYSLVVSGSDNPAFGQGGAIVQFQGIPVAVSTVPIPGQAVLYGAIVATAVGLAEFRKSRLTLG